MANLHLQLAEIESNVGNMSGSVAWLVEGLAIEKSQYINHASHIRKVTQCFNQGWLAKAYFNP
jgi:hypothetical protein